MSSTDEQPKIPARIIALGVAVCLLSIAVIVFLTSYITPPFETPSSFLKWFLWCVPFAVACLAFLISWELIVGPFFMRWLHGSEESGEAVIRMGALGIAILIIVFLVIRIFLD